jgi:nucleolar pre-ribosomal-associated protein 2
MILLFHLSYQISNFLAYIEILIDTMLQNQTNISNPIIRSSGTNAFAVKSLLQVPVSLVQNKKTRERIFRSWLPTGDSAADDSQELSYKSTALDPAVLSLKIKFMQRPVLYEVSKSWSVLTK